MSKNMINNWDEAYQLLKVFFTENGHGNVPHQYLDEKTGIKLGVWLDTQRTSFKDGKLTPERKALLLEAGVMLEVHQEQWEKMVSLFISYAQNHGPLVPQSYICDNGERLGLWVTTQRVNYKNGTIAKARISRLNDLGFVWEPFADSWEKAFSKLSDFHKLNDHSNVPKDFECNDGFMLGQWVDKQRQAYKKSKLDDVRVKHLTQIGFVWDPFEAAWQDGLMRLNEYIAANNAVPTAKFKLPCGFGLGPWLSRQRIAIKKGTLSKQKTALLNQALDLVN